MDESLGTLSVRAKLAIDEGFSVYINLRDKVATKRAASAQTSENSTNIGCAPNTEKDDNKSFPATQRKWLTAARNARQSRKFLFRRSFWR